jgi:hypothetical protein
VDKLKVFFFSAGYRIAWCDTEASQPGCPPEAFAFKPRYRIFEYAD